MLPPAPNNAAAGNGIRTDLKSAPIANRAPASTESAAQAGESATQTIATTVSIPLGSVEPALAPIASSLILGVARPATNLSAILGSPANANVSTPLASFAPNMASAANMEIMSEAEQAVTSTAAAVEALAAALSVKPAPTAPGPDIVATPSANVLGPRAGRSVELVALRDGRDNGGPVEQPPILPGQPQLAPDPVQQALQQHPGAKAARAAAVFLPQVADLLSDFSLANLARIDQSVSVFLSRLEGAPSEAPPDGALDLYPWLLAGVLTTAACAMARWQLRKTPVLQSVDWLTIPANTWNVFHENEHARTTR
jgi:hypothetical protein